jgi:hypothetical protein
MPPSRLPPNRLLLMVLVAVGVVLTVGVFSLLAVLTSALPRQVVAVQNPAGQQQAPAVTDPPTHATDTTGGAADNNDPVATAPAGDPAADQQPAYPHVPATAEQVAALIGGSPSRWTRHDEHGRYVPDNAWLYRTFGRSVLTFTIPAGCTVIDENETLYAGQQVRATDFTIYFG